MPNFFLLDYTFRDFITGIVQQGLVKQVFKKITKTKTYYRKKN